MPGSVPAARVYVHTLGCPKNEADSRAVVRSLVAGGAGVVADPEAATHILLNTCGFIQEAKEESIGAVLDACACYGDKQVLVMGCLVERYRDELEKGIPEVAGWFGLTDIGGLTAAVVGSPAIFESTATPSAPSTTTLFPHETTGSAATAAPPATTYAYLKISDGCDEPCSFCAIPAIKGAYRSATTAEILQDAEECLAQGVRELILVGQDTAIWKCDGLGLTGLIDLLAADQRVRRVRVMYLQPEHVTDAFLRYMAGQPKLCRYLDVPFQHSHPGVLRRMGRRGDGSAYLDLLGRARRLMPDVSVRSAFIVGFPGETDDQFEHLLAFVEEAGFDHAGGFVYSPEEGTSASVLKPRVRRLVAQDRLNRLTAQLGVRAESVHQGLVGSQVTVMIDSRDPEETGEGMAAVGRTSGQAPEVDGVTYIEGDLPEEIGLGDVVKVTVGAVLGYDLVGRFDAS
jgi:ribosomal protein S12 methylthiotransferase